MVSLQRYLPSRSALAHMRFGFSLFLMPVFFFATSQANGSEWQNVFLTFVVWHILVYPASNGYNSYYDKDEGSIALLERPPAVDRSLYYSSLFLDLVAIILSALVSVYLLLAVLLYGVFSKLYSHPSVRLKKYSVLSFLIVFIFQGAMIYWSTYFVVSGAAAWSKEVIVAGLICSFLIGASYPLTQVYQHQEDGVRGDKTLSMALGIRGSFWFSAFLFLISFGLIFWYWQIKQQLHYFYFFLFTAVPVVWVFLAWFRRVWADPAEANYRNMTKMTAVSGFMMLLYFGALNFF